jgi:RNA dependent RNA polymerase
MNVKNPVYLSTLRKAESNSLPLSTVLIYRANLKVDGRLDLLEPLRADDKRIFRMYGADRFLEISISKNVTNNTIKDFFSKDVVVANRRFKFFWFKKENGIHPILFAVSGQGIKEIDVESARDRCIPTKMNHDMSLGKWIKRMKLSFSTTTATCVLPPKSVSLLQDFEKVGIAEIDGAGLISSEALKAVCDAYTKEKDKKCGSGFQGRLAG